MGSPEPLGCWFGGGDSQRRSWPDREDRANTLDSEPTCCRTLRGHWNGAGLYLAFDAARRAGGILHIGCFRWSLGVHRRARRPPHGRSGCDYRPLRTPQPLAGSAVTRARIVPPSQGSFQNDGPGDRYETRSRPLSRVGRIPLAGSRMDRRNRRRNTPARTASPSGRSGSRPHPAQPRRPDRPQRPM